MTELGLQRGFDLLDRLGGDTVLETRELGAHFGRKQVDACRRDLPDLDIDAARILEQAPEPNPERIERAVGSTGERPESLTPREPRELAVPEEHDHAFVQGAQRPRRSDEACLLAERQRARTREQVERHRGRHRGRNGDRQEMDDEPVRAPIPMRQAESHERRDAPPKDPRGERPDPASSNAEQAQRDRGRHEGEKDRRDDPRENQRDYVCDERVDSHAAPPLTIRPRTADAGTAELEAVARVHEVCELATRLECQSTVGVEQQRRRFRTVELEAVRDAAPGNT